MKRRLFTLFLIFVLLALVGTVFAFVRSNAKARIVNIKEGMSPAEVRAILGAPKASQPMKTLAVQSTQAELNFGTGTLARVIGTGNRYALWFYSYEGYEKSVHFWVCFAPESSMESEIKVVAVKKVDVNYGLKYRFLEGLPKWLYSSPRRTLTPIPLPPQ